MTIFCGFYALRSSISLSLLSRNMFNKFQSNSYSKLNQDDPHYAEVNGFNQTIISSNSSGTSTNIHPPSSKIDEDEADPTEAEREDFTSRNSYKNPEGVRIFSEPSGFTAVVMVEDVCPEKLFMTVSSIYNQAMMFYCSLFLRS